MSPDPTAATSHFPQGANVFCTDPHLKDIMQNFSPWVWNENIPWNWPEFKQANFTVSMIFLKLFLFYCIAFNSVLYTMMFNDF